MASPKCLYGLLLISVISTVTSQEVQESITSSGSQDLMSDLRQETLPAPLELNQTIPVEEGSPTSAPVEPDKPESQAESVVPDLDEPPILPQLAFRLAETSTGLLKSLLTDTSNSTKVVGSKCSTDQDCDLLNNTYCYDGMCLCSPGYVPSKHRLDLCLRVPSGLGDTCEEEAQCESIVFDSECSDGKCICPPNYIYSQKRCWEKQFLGGQCNTTDQCADVKFAVCAQDVCTCQEPMIPTSDNKCLPPAGSTYKAACEEDIQCTYSYGDDARCSDGQCVCSNTHHYNGTKCVVDKKLGEACLTDIDCAVTETNDQVSRMCLRNACTCAIGYSALPGEDICTKSSGEELAVSLTWVLCIVLAKYYLA